MLNVREKLPSDNSIVNYEFHSYQSYSAAELKYNDECRLCIQQQDLLTVPGLSEIHIQGKFVQHADEKKVPTKCQLVNNFVPFLFEEIRYELGGVVVDRVKNPGITTSMKGYVSYTPGESMALMNSGWRPMDSATVKMFDAATGKFDICWPLASILGFAEDYKKIVINLRQELVLIRATDDLNAMIEATGTEKGKINIHKITWRVPHVTVSDYEKLKILEVVEKNVPISIVHRKWELFSYPTLQHTHTFTWVLKASTFLEKPRYIIFGLQTDRKNNLLKDPSLFDHCKLRNVKLYLNSQSYPYENLNLNFNDNQYALAYNMYTQFQQSYYYNRKLYPEPLLNIEKYKSMAPLIVIDCSYQNEIVKNATVDARLEFDANEQIPANTSAYCLVLHEQFIQYEPLTGIVRSRSL